MANQLDDFSALGATIVALTPELPEFSGETAKANQVPFPILTDLNNQVADEYGLVFDLGILTELYENFAAISKKNGAKAGAKLPLTATYIIDQTGTIRYSFIDTDYRKRAEPSELIKALSDLSNSAGK